MLVLSSLLSVAARASKAAPPPESSILETVRDSFLYAGPYGNIMYYLCLFGFCLANCRAILKAKPDTHFAHGLALSVLTSYGGSTLCAIMCGNPVVFVVNESLVTLVSIAWCVSHNSLTRKPVDALLSSTPGAYYLSVAYEVMRCHVLLGCSKMAATTLAAYRTPFYPVPVVGPLIGAMLGGCGGGFMPLDKGLTPVEKGINWRIGSAVIASVWMLAVTQDPTGKEFATSVLPALANPDWARFVPVAFFVLAPLAGLAGLIGANPLEIKKAAAKKVKKN